MSASHSPTSKVVYKPLTHSPGQATVSVDEDLYLVWPSSGAVIEPGQGLSSEGS